VGACRQSRGAASSWGVGGRAKGLGVQRKRRRATGGEDGWPLGGQRGVELWPGSAGSCKCGSSVAFRLGPTEGRRLLEASRDEDARWAGSTLVGGGSFTPGGGVCCRSMQYARTGGVGPPEWQRVRGVLPCHPPGRATGAQGSGSCGAPHRRGRAHHAMCVRVVSANGGRGGQLGVRAVVRGATGVRCLARWGGGCRWWDTVGGGGLVCLEGPESAVGNWVVGSAVGLAYRA